MTRIILEFPQHQPNITGIPFAVCDLWGFIEIENFVFGERSQMVVDPAEEKLKTEFTGVKRSFIPLQAIVRIDEVEKEGVATISKGDNIAPFPIQFAPRTQQSNPD